MKRIAASVGLIALGAASVQAQSPIAAPSAKWWSVSATVRGFYDDNVNTLPNPSHNDRVWGYELNPGAGISLGNEQTTLAADYHYSFLYYDHKPNANSVKYDQDHLFTLALNHAFSERYSLHVKDSFVVGQQPDILRSGVAIVTPFRVSGNNIVNSGEITFEAQLTPLFGLELGYANSFIDYKDDKVSTAPGTVFLVRQNGILIPVVGTAVNPSLSGELDRIEQTAHLDTRWTVSPETVAVFGYSFRDVSYIGDQPIAAIAVGTPPTIKPEFSDSRNNQSHEVHVGVDHAFRPDLTGSIRAGAAYYDYYNPPSPSTSFGPRITASLTYLYRPESTFRIVFQEDRTASDVVQSGDVKPVRDTETSVVYAALNHRIIPNLYGSLKGTFQNSFFNGGGTGSGGFDGKSERFYEFGADLEYKFSPHFSTHMGYDYDKLDSEIAGRDYDRNKVYIGATASY